MYERVAVWLLVCLCLFGRITLLLEAVMRS